MAPASRRVSAVPHSPSVVAGRVETVARSAPRHTLYWHRCVEATHVPLLHSLFAPQGVPVPHCASVAAHGSAMQTFVV